MTEGRIVAWLLEKPISADHPKVEWIGVIDGFLNWTDDPDKALRLATRKDANALCEIVDDCWHITEHIWEPSDPLGEP